LGGQHRCGGRNMPLLLVRKRNRRIQSCAANRGQLPSAKRMRMCGGAAAPRAEPGCAAAAPRPSRHPLGEPHAARGLAAARQGIHLLKGRAKLRARARRRGPGLGGEGGGARRRAGIAPNTGARYACEPLRASAAQAHHCARCVAPLLPGRALHLVEHDGRSARAPAGAACQPATARAPARVACCTSAAQTHAAPEVPCARGPVCLSPSLPPPGRSLTTWFISVDFPLLWGPMIATTW
jgi:hypothetical protein